MHCGRLGWVFDLLERVGDPECADQALAYLFFSEVFLPDCCSDLGLDHGVLQHRPQPAKPGDGYDSPVIVGVEIFPLLRSFHKAFHQGHQLAGLPGPECRAYADGASSWCGEALVVGIEGELPVGESVRSPTGAI